MAMARVTIKGQVTIPRAIRSRMGIKAGDSVFFVLEGDRVVLVPIKRRSLTELFGSLPVERPFPGRDEERRVVQEHVARHVMGETESDNS